MTIFLRRIIVCVLIVVLGASIPFTVARAEAADATVNNLPPSFDFPNSFTFIADVSAPNPIESIELNYVADVDTCITFYATAYPQFEKKKTTKVTWTWDLKKSGGFPIGTTVKWNWKITDNTGHVTYTQIVQLDWMNYGYEWQTAENDDITLYWIKGDQAFGEEMLGIAQNTLSKVGFKFGLQPHKHYKVFVYPDNESFRNDQLYEESWTGGLSYTDAGVVALGIDPENEYQLTWGKSAMVHELTHAIFAQKEFTCLGSFPTWMVEGIAQYVEFSLYPIPEDVKQRYLDYITANGVFPIRTMNEGFGTDSEKVANLYTQSYYLVHYLVETYGKDRYLAVYQDISDGKKAEDAIKTQYGLSFEQLEEAFATYMNASTSGILTTPTPKVIPTIIPTIMPISSSVQNDSLSSAMNFVYIGIAIFVILVLIIGSALVIRLRRRNDSTTITSINTSNTDDTTNKPEGA